MDMGTYCKDVKMIHFIKKRNTFHPSISIGAMDEPLLDCTGLRGSSSLRGLGDIASESALKA